MLDVYFRQCAVLVTARDLAVMAATLANGGVNPVTGEQVISPLCGRAHAVGDDLAPACTTMPANGSTASACRPRAASAAASSRRCRRSSGSALFSPLLDEHGNSVRGLRGMRGAVGRISICMCSIAPTTCVPASSPITISARRVSAAAGSPHEQRHARRASGRDPRSSNSPARLTFANVDYIAAPASPAHAAAAVPGARPAARAADLRRRRARCWRISSPSLRPPASRPVLAGIERDSRNLPASLQDWLDDPKAVRDFSLLDEAIEWAEDQIIYPLWRLHPCSRR